MTSPPRPARRSVAIRNAHPQLQVPRAAVRRAIALLDARADRFGGGCPAGELSLVFLTDAALARIHADFMADPSPTDVITFAGDPAAGLAGEVCVSVDTAARYVGLPRAAARPSRATDRQAKFASELTLYLVHGWLHLAGYDDLAPAKKRRMRAAEKRALALLRAARAIPAFLLV
ncbi:MAG: rRNA maturation RNase YbeY [Opitutales bacterium]